MFFSYFQMKLYSLHSKEQKIYFLKKVFPWDYCWFSMRSKLLKKMQKELSYTIPALRKKQNFRNYQSFLFFLYSTSFCFSSSQIFLYLLQQYCCFFSFYSLLRLLISFTSSFCSLSSFFQKYSPDKSLSIFIYMKKKI